VKKKLAIAVCGTLLSSAVLANHASYFYGAADAGIFNAAFDALYAYQSPAVANPQSITNTAYQRGYMGGLKLGYHRPFHTHYFYNTEISGDIDSDRSSFQSGASGPFTDNMWIDGHADLSFVPGMIISNTMSVYMKLGLSVALLRDRLTSYTGSFNTQTGYSASKVIPGFLAGLGVSKSVSEHVDVFTEADYHDYGNRSMQTFLVQNATYASSVKIHWYDVVVGAAYHFA
jgi:opacity protein-like surface antigen